MHWFRHPDSYRELMNAEREVSLKFKVQGLMQRREDGKSGSFYS